jgi:excisionase family DNA binding protein
LSLGPAARRLGVDPDTLRRWADNGRIEAFTTPGGHRRFERRAIDRLIAERHAPRLALSSLGATTASLSAAYRRGTTPERTGGASLDLDGRTRESLREDGRRLVDALLRSLDTTDPVERGRIEAEAQTIAVDHAVRLRAAGAGLTEAVARFVVARASLLDALGAVARRRRLDAERTATVHRDASALLDRLLVAFVAPFDRTV